MFVQSNVMREINVTSMLTERTLIEYFCLESQPMEPVSVLLISDDIYYIQ